MYVCIIINSYVSMSATVQDVWISVLGSLSYNVSHDPQRIMSLVFTMSTDVRHCRRHKTVDIHATASRQNCIIHTGPFFTLYDNHMHTQTCDHSMCACVQLPLIGALSGHVGPSNSASQVPSITQPLKVIYSPGACAILGQTFS